MGEHSIHNSMAMANEKHKSSQVIYWKSQSLWQVHFRRPQEHDFRKPQLSDLGSQNKWVKAIQIG